MDDIALRFTLAAQLNRMKYGDARALDRDIAHKAWPPTGDHDRSFEGAFHALALASGGHRPETSYTTQERIERDLDETFTVEQRTIDGTWVIRRRLSACPHCHGSGFVKRWPIMAAELAPIGYADIAMAETVTVETIKCEHLPS